MRQSGELEGRITLLVVDDTPELAQTVQHLLADAPDIRVVGTATNARDAVELARKRRPLVILMDVRLREINGLQATQALCAEMPARVILMAPEDSKEAMQRAMRAGARDYLVKPLRAEELLRSIRRVARGPGAATPPPPAAGEARRHQGRVIAVCGTKGGVGRSVVAVNLAVSLAAIAGEVALVDANLETGDAHLLLDLNAPRTLFDLADELRTHRELDFETVTQTAALHPGSGVQLFRAPKRPEEAEIFQQETLSAILVELREHYDWIVVDVESHFSDTAIAALKRAERLVVVSTLEVTAIQRLRDFQETLALLKIPRELCWHVANRYDGGYQARIASVEKAADVRFAAKLPEDVRTVITSVNRGQPFALAARRSPIAREVARLAHRLREQMTEQPVAARGQAVVARRS